MDKKYLVDNDPSYYEAWQDVFFGAKLDSYDWGELAVLFRELRNEIQSDLNQKYAGDQYRILCNTDWTEVRKALHKEKSRLEREKSRLEKQIADPLLASAHSLLEDDLIELTARISKVVREISTATENIKEVSVRRNILDMRFAGRSSGDVRVANKPSKGTPRTMLVHEKGVGTRKYNVDPEKASAWIDREGVRTSR